VWDREIPHYLHVWDGEIPPQKYDLFSRSWQSLGLVCNFCSLGGISLSHTPIDTGNPHPSIVSKPLITTFIRMWPGSPVDIEVFLSLHCSHMDWYHAVLWLNLPFHPMSALVCLDLDIPWHSVNELAKPLWHSTWLSYLILYLPRNQ
jgi:hypothetical protein